MTEEILTNDHKEQLHHALSNAIKNNLPDSIVGDIIRLIDVITDATPLHEAVKSGRLQVIDKILKSLSPNIKQDEILISILDRTYNDYTIIYATFDLLVGVLSNESALKIATIAVTRNDYIVLDALLSRVDLSVFIRDLVELCISNTHTDTVIKNKRAAYCYIMVMSILLKHLQPLQTNKYILSRILAHAGKHRWQQIVEATIRILNTLVNEKGEAK